MPTDYVLLSLVIAIIVIAVLLLVCWKNKNENKEMRYELPRRVINNNSLRMPIYSASRDEKDLLVVPRRDDVGQMGKTLSSGGYTYFGTAQRNRDYNNRADNVVMDMKGYGDYNDVSRYLGLERSVYDSHNQWIQDMNHTTSGASMQSERDDLGDLPVSWIGLRRPNYTDHPGIEASARQDVSFSGDQMPVYRHFQL